MTNVPTGKPSNPKRIAWTTGILCVSCCAIPFIGVAVGSATLAAFAVYSEKVAVVVLAVGVALLAYKRFTRKTPPSCDLDCSCRPEPDKMAENSKD